MTESDKKDIKLQEWIVMFDGQINHSEMILESDSYHNDLINQAEKY